MTFKNGSTPVLATAFSYEPHRDLLTSVENIRDPAGTPATISKYDYENDEIRRRKNVKTTGSAFSGLGGDHHWEWGYNGRSELTNADRLTGVTLGSGSHVSGAPADFDYNYDPIGNRTSK